MKIIGRVLLCNLSMRHKYTMIIQVKRIAMVSRVTYLKNNHVLNSLSIKDIQVYIPSSSHRMDNVRSLYHLFLSLI
jgi:hypothetical protein